MQNFEAILKKYDYNIPKELIAQKPASPRDSSRLLVYLRKQDKVFYDRFANIAGYLPKNAVLVFNETKVLPARLILKKETGGKVKILYVAKKGNYVQTMADRKLIIGAKLWLDKKYFFTVKGNEGKYYLLMPSFKISSIFSILEKYGLTPIPPYIKNSPLSEKELKTKYQAIFAKRRGSVAAPTASLHFTKRLLKKIKNAGMDIRFITLHVNLGTFAPLAEKNLKTSRLHKEYYEIDKKTALFLNRTKKDKRPIIAVGTTVARTLESAAVSGISATKNKTGGQLYSLSGTTDLFIQEGYKFKFVDGISTNFHVPRSSLLMLVAALTGRKKLFELYGKATEKKFRFFSFGDGMLIY